jgi:hypothetical protein
MIEIGDGEVFVSVGYIGRYRVFYEATGVRKQNLKSKSFTTLDESEGFFWLRVLMKVESSPGRMASRI